MYLVHLKKIINLENYLRDNLWLQYHFRILSHKNSTHSFMYDNPSWHLKIFLDINMNRWNYMLCIFNIFMLFRVCTFYRTKYDLYMWSEFFLCIHESKSLLIKIKKKRNFQYQKNYFKFYNSKNRKFVYVRTYKKHSPEKTYYELSGEKKIKFLHKIVFEE